MTTDDMIDEILTAPFETEENRAKTMEWLRNLPPVPNNSKDKGDLWFYSMHKLASKVSDPVVRNFISQSLFKYIYRQQQQ